MTVDLLANEEAGGPLAFATTPVARCASPPVRRRRRRASSNAAPSPPPQPTDSWEEAFASAMPCLAAAQLTEEDVPALERWRSMEHLVAHMPSINVHESPQQTVQMSSTVQPLGAVSELTWGRPWLERNVSARELFVTADGDGRATGASSSSSAAMCERASFPYFFSSVDALPPVLRADLGELLPRLRTPFLPALESDAWAGVPCVSSPLHYDAAHNVYSQLVGTKRWLLMPPEETRSLYVYPRIHPSTRQSQMNLRAMPNDERFTRFHTSFRGPRTGVREYAGSNGEGSAAANGGKGGEGGSGGCGGGTRCPSFFEAVMRPGERLYVPPYWWHRVSVVGNSSAISVAVYSQSTPMRAYGVIKEHPLPTLLTTSCNGRSKSWSSCLPALRSYILALGALRAPCAGVSVTIDLSFACAVGRRCACFADADAFEAHEADPGVDAVIELLETRYRYLDDAAVVDGLGPMLEAARLRMRAKVHPPLPPLPPDAVNRLRAHARALRASVIALPSKGDGVVSPAIWRNEMHSLIEDVACAAVGAREVEAALTWISGKALV